MRRFLVSFVILTIFALPSLASPETIDNSAALATIDSDIAKKNARLNEAKRLVEEGKKRIGELEKAAQKMVDAQKELGDLAARAEIVRQNNAMKIIARLGVSIASLGASALTAPKVLLEGAATTINIVIIDPLLNEIVTFLDEFGGYAGIAPPQANKIEYLKEFSTGAFPSYNRLKYYLEIKVGDDHAIIDRDKNIVLYAENGAKETEAAHREMAATTARYRSLLQTLNAQIVKLTREIEMLRRLRRSAAGEGPNAEEIEVEAATVETGISTVGEGYLERLAQYEEARRKAPLAGGILLPHVKLRSELAQKIKKTVARLRVLGEQLFSPPLEEKTGDLWAKLEARNQERDQQEKKLGQQYVLKYATVNDLLNCGPTNLPFAQAIANAKKWHEGRMAIEKARIEDLAQHAENIGKLSDELKIAKETKEIIQLSAELVSLKSAYTKVDETIEGRTSDGTGQIWDKEAAGTRGYPGYINEKLAGLARGKQYLLQEIQQKEIALEDAESMWEAVNDPPALAALARDCIDKAASEAKQLFTRVERSARASEMYKASLNKRIAFYKELVGQGLLLHNTEGGANIYSLNPEWLDQNINADDGACKGIDDLRKKLSVPVAQEQMLITRVAVTREAATHLNMPDLGGNPILEQNNPGLFAEWQRNGERIQEIKAQWRRLEKERHHSNLEDFDGELQKYALHVLITANRSAGLKNLYTTQLQQSKDQRAHLKNLQVLVESRLGRDRINETDFESFKKSLQASKEDYASHLQCLGDAHPWNREIVEAWPKLEKAISKLSGKPTYKDATPLIAKLSRLKNDLENLGISDDENFEKTVMYYKNLHDEKTATYETNKDNYAGNDQQTIRQLLYEIDRLFPVYFDHLANQKLIDDNAKFSEFYESFKQAYEAKNASLVMSHLADDWTAAGGVTLMDLEDNLRNMYNVFDEIEYQLSGLRIQTAGNDLLTASYHVSIRGRIFDNDTLHEEGSSVTDLLRRDDNGRLRIIKTESGRYW